MKQKIPMREKIVYYIFKSIAIFSIVLVFLMLLYLLLGSLGLLPQYFYDACNNASSVKEAVKLGCCEDRSNWHPVSRFFGSDNCDRYRLKENINNETT